MQPIIRDEHGVVRFQRNAIVCYLLDCNGGEKIDMNALSRMEFSQEDRCQFAQLIGYSVCGYHELSYVSDEHAKEASAAARKSLPGLYRETDHVGCRDGGCEIHCGVEKENKESKA